ncbi:MAG: hypothetical protein ABW185_16800 [Sedimenticola sp.]
MDEELPAHVGNIEVLDVDRQVGDHSVHLGLELNVMVLYVHVT